MPTIDYFIFHFINPQISFSQFFIFYFFILSSVYFIKNYLYCIKFVLCEFPVLLLSIFSFIFLLLYTTDLIVLYFCLEGLGFSTYIFFGLAYNNLYMRYEGVLKYFILNSFASILFLFGTTFIYFSSLSTAYNYNILLIYSDTVSNNYVVIIGLIFILLSFFFKLGVFPCLLWIIDIYESLPFALIYVLITLYKFVLFIIFLKLLTVVFYPLIFIWQPILIISGISSLGISCIGALIQYKLKRFIGYTSVNQIGYILLGLSVGTTEGILASYNFLIFYIIINTIFFSFLLFGQLFLTSDKNILSEFRYLTDLSNFSYFLPTSILFVFIISIIAIIGLPPIANFFIKYDLLVNLLQISNNLIFIILIFSTISAFYYIRILKILFFDNLILKWSNFKQKKLKINILALFNFYLISFYLYFNYLFKQLFLLCSNIKFNNIFILFYTNNIQLNQLYLNNIFIIIDFWTFILLYSLI